MASVSKWSSKTEVSIKEMEDLAKKIENQRRIEKELMKCRETPEEKKSRKLAKKELKEIINRQEIISEDYLNEANRFGDSNLLSSFVWKKKLEKDGVHHLDKSEKKKIMSQKQQEMNTELEKVKARRKEVEYEKMLQETQLRKEIMNKETEQFKNWEMQEESFYLNQAKERSKSRLINKRGKAIDYLACFINNNEPDLSFKLNNPIKIIKTLLLNDCEELLENLKEYKSLDKENDQYWNDMITIICSKIKILKNTQENRQIINETVSNEVRSILKGKTFEQLIQLSHQIKNKLNSGGSIDVGYWEEIQEKATVTISIARVKSIYEQNKEKYTTEDTLGKSESLQQSDQQQMTKAYSIRSVKLLTEEECIEIYKSLNIEPILIPFEDVDKSLWVTVKADQDNIAKLRHMISDEYNQGQTDLESLNMYLVEASKGLKSNEEMLIDEAPLKKKYDWENKCKSRKPRFFNRIHTGYEWNKYNQTHYDLENPPPKIVQGYKFNIFYPDLLDKTVAPHYDVNPCLDNKDYAMLKITAGPPYEDIAFKIINRTWEYTKRDGYLCQFQNGVFQLWFHFRRYKYRR